MFTELIINGFRGIRNESFLLGNKTHIIGKNGSGKTHILDAIHLLSGSKNIYGNAKLESGDRIEGFFGDDSQQKSYVFLADEKREFFCVQSKKITRPKYLESLPFRSVYVSPFDMNLLYFSPSLRRDYLDDILVRSYAQFSSVKRDFEVIMKQRNALLKKIREEEASVEGLDFWDVKFSEIAVLYGMYRMKYITFVQEKMDTFPEFFKKYQLVFLYQGDWILSKNPEKYIQEYLLKNRQRDIFSGYTHIGPHRDDFGFFLQGNPQEKENKPVQFFLSRGEIKMLLLGMKVIESDFIARLTSKKVILLIDDIFAELDEENIILFLNTIIQHQIILTSQKPLPEAINPQKFTCINLSNS